MAIINGRILDPVGQPAANGEIYASSTVLSFTETTTTDADGYFSFIWPDYVPVIDIFGFNNPECDLRLNGYEYTWFMDNYAIEADWCMVPILMNVVDAVSGLGVYNASVDAIRQGPDLIGNVYPIPATTTGGYLFNESIPAGTYTIQVTHDSYETYNRESVVVTSDTYLLSDAQLTPLPTPPPGDFYAVSGTVTNEDGLVVAGVVVSVVGYSTTATTDALGHYSVSLPAGKVYTLEFSHQDYITTTAEILSPLSADISVNVNSYTYKTVTVFGVVTNRHGDPIKNATVRVDGGSNVGTTDAVGRFSISGIHTGSSIDVSISYPESDPTVFTFDGSPGAVVNLGKHMLRFTNVIYGITQKNTSVGLFNPHIVEFGVDTLATMIDWPYAPSTDIVETAKPKVPSANGVTVELIVTDPDGIEYKHPAFFYEPYEYAVMEDTYNLPSDILGHAQPKEWLHPTNEAYWVARFCPTKLGTWAYRIRVTDAQHEAGIESPSRVITCGSSNRHGYIKPSQADCRYFEHADGYPWHMSVGTQGIWDASYTDAVEGPASIGNDGVTNLMARIWLQSEGSISLIGHPRASCMYGGTGLSSNFNGTYAQAGRFTCWQVSSIDKISARLFVKPNTKYKIRARVYCPGMTQGEVFAAFTTREPGFTYVGRTSGVDASSGWTQIEGYVTTGDQYHANMYVISSGLNTSYYYVDDIEAYEVLCDAGTHGDEALGRNIVGQGTADAFRKFPAISAAKFDALVQSSQENDVYLKVILLGCKDPQAQKIRQDGTVSEPWDDNVYAAYWVDGSIVNSPLHPMRQIHRFFYRWIIGRYGWAESIHSWELVNEGQPESLAHADALAHFYDYMHGSIDTGPIINEHMASTSAWTTSAAWKDIGFAGDILWHEANNKLDYIDPHRYAHIDDKYPHDAAIDIVGTAEPMSLAEDDEERKRFVFYSNNNFQPSVFNASGRYAADPRQIYLAGFCEQSQSLAPGTIVHYKGDEVTCIVRDYNGDGTNVIVFEPKPAEYAKQLDYDIATGKVKRLYRRWIRSLPADKQLTVDSLLDGSSYAEGQLVDLNTKDTPVYRVTASGAGQVLSNTNNLAIADWAAELVTSGLLSKLDSDGADAEVIYMADTYVVSQLGLGPEILDPTYNNIVFDEERGKSVIRTTGNASDFVSIAQVPLVAGHTYRLLADVKGINVTQPYQYTLSSKIECDVLYFSRDTRAEYKRDFGADLWKLTDTDGNLVNIYGGTNRNFPWQAVDLSNAFTPPDITDDLQYAYRATIQLKHGPQGGEFRFDNIRLVDETTGETVWVPNLDLAIRNPDFLYPELEHIYIGYTALGNDPETNRYIRKPCIRGEIGTTSKYREQVLRLDGEYDRIKNAGKVYDSNSTYHRKRIWAHLAPGAMYDMYWYHSLFEEGHYLVAIPFYNFVKDIPINNGNYRDVKASVGDGLNSTNCIVAGQKDLENNKAHFWISNLKNTWYDVTVGKTPETISGSISVGGLSPNTYTVSTYDTITGTYVSEESVEVTEGAPLVVAVSDLEYDVAYDIRPHTDTGPNEPNDPPTPQPVPLTQIWSVDPFMLSLVRPKR